MIVEIDCDQWHVVASTTVTMGLLCGRTAESAFSVRIIDDEHMVCANPCPGCWHLVRMDKPTGLRHQLRLAAEAVDPHASENWGTYGVYANMSYARAASPAAVLELLNHIGDQQVEIERLKATAPQ